MRTNIFRHADDVDEQHKSAILDVTGWLTLVVVERVRSSHNKLFGSRPSGYLAVACDAVELALDHISSSDALYHNVEHTAQVALVGIAMLHGRHETDSEITPGQWLNTIVALLCHDIGYVRGICRTDHNDSLATGVADNMVSPTAGSSDASLMPHHVDRGKLFVEEQFRNIDLVDIEVVKANIERTRFPHPGCADLQGDDGFPGAGSWC